MSKPLAIRAAYSDWKLVRTRQVIQLVFEVPLAEADAAYEVIGGMPDPSKERWFAIAALQAEAPPANVIKIPDKRDWHNVQPAAQAGIRCNEGIFISFLRETFANDWRESANAAECVRRICGVQSRAELSTDRRARVMWHQLDQQFLAWKTMEQQS